MVIDISWVEAHIIYICFLVSMGKSMESEVIDICFHGLKPMATRAELYLLNFIIVAIPILKPTSWKRLSMNEPATSTLSILKILSKEYPTS